MYKDGIVGTVGMLYVCIVHTINSISWSLVCLCCRYVLASSHRIANRNHSQLMLLNRLQSIKLFSSTLIW